MKKRYGFVYSLLLSIALYSCVPERLMKEEQAKRKACETELAGLKTTAAECDSKLAEANKTLNENEKEIAQHFVDLGNGIGNVHLHSPVLADGKP